jgi:CRISPR-associated protein Cas6
MYWQEETKRDERPATPDDVVDLAFTIACRSLPVDHAWALFAALRPLLPWLEGGDGAGVHPIHVADSGNGWMRPERPDDLLYLSRRTRLVLRVPRARLAEAEQLSGRTLDVAGNRLTVEKPAVRPLSTHPAQFARYVAADAAQDENGFLAEMHRALGAMGIRPKKMLCGIGKALATPDGTLATRSLMIADLTPEEAVRLQQRGLGRLQHLGCGLFIPHKDIREVRQVLD